ncbi:modification methylase HaeIII [archaeon BMS3Abin16]|nr:modification methylase HaeIII [archaeon BMS3Abin16]
MNGHRTLTAVDLFSGAGGFSLAARETGIKVMAAVEIDKNAGKTYKKNFVIGHDTPPVFIEDDIVDLDPFELMKKSGLSIGECDILMGGPPCQGFSTHRLKGSGVDDPRNKLLIRYFDFVRAIKPKAFIVENVSGLLWPRHAEYLNKFLRMTKQAGYIIYGPTLLNAKDFGVPQNRKRVFIIGIRSDLKVELIWPPKQTHFSLISKEVKKRGLPAWQTASTVFQEPIPTNDPNSIHMNHSNELIGVFQSTPKNGGSRSQSNRILSCHGNHDGHKDVYGRIDPNKLGPTITTGCVNPSKGRFLHPTENHGISVRHAARFQTFPDDFIFEGGLMSCAVQIGNAVPIKMGKVIIKSVANVLETISCSDLKMEIVTNCKLSVGNENRVHV